MLQRLSRAGLGPCLGFFLLLCLLGSEFLPASHAARPQQRKPKRLTNSDVIEMVKAREPVEAIIAKVRDCACQFDLSLPALQELKTARVVDAVIVAMLEAPFVRDGSLGGPGCAASSASAGAPGAGVNSRVTLMLFRVVVTDSFLQVYRGVSSEQFEIQEDGKNQKVVFCARDETPGVVGFLVDTSGSMSSKQINWSETLLPFWLALPPGTEFFLVTFGDAADVRVAPTTDFQQISNGVAKLAPKGRTALLDAVYLGLKLAGGRSKQKKTLVLITDGGDSASRFIEKDIRDFAKESDVQLYAVGLFEPLTRGMPLEALTGRSLVGDLAEMTGGQLFTVENLHLLPSFTGRVAVGLRSQYLLGYEPTNTVRDGKWRKVKVKVVGPKQLGKLEAHTRTGYYAPKQ